MWRVLFQWFETICHPCTLHTALGEQLLPNFNQMITLKKSSIQNADTETFPSSLLSPVSISSFTLNRGLAPVGDKGEVEIINYSD